MKPNIELVEFLCLTPLYHFTSDAPELVIDRGLRIRRFGNALPIPSIDVLSRHLQVYEPDYLLLHEPFLSGDFPLQAFVDWAKHASSIDSGQMFSETGSLRKMADVIELFLAPTTRLLKVLRLFKPGRLRAGDTYIVWRNKTDDQGWRTLANGRASEMTVDYHVLASKTMSYVLQPTDIPALFAFREILAPVLQKPTLVPQVETALELYGADDGQKLDAVGAITALEALLTKKEETEGLTYRLSMRIANLLGNNPDARKTIFQDVKSFYTLRSKIVHGVELDTKFLNRLNELDRLHETLRKVLLSVMALLSEGLRIADLPDVIDVLAFDDHMRQQIQATASKFLVSVEKTV